MRRALAVGLWLGQLGCYTANRYDLPDTMPRGKAVVMLSLEAARVSRQRADPNFGAVTDRHEHLALVPSVSGRYALVDGFEIGGTSGVGRYTVETKVRLADGLAVAPGGGLIGDFLIADVPLLARARLHERVSLVLSPGVAYAATLTRLAEVHPLSVDRDDAKPDGWMMRAGFGLNVRVFGPLSVMPEVTTLTSVSSPQLVWTTVGLGVRVAP